MKAALDKLFEAMEELEKLSYRPPEEEARNPLCSWCATPKDQAKHMIAGPKVFICDTCVDRCAELLAERRASE